MDRLHPELIWAYTLDDEQIGPIHLAFDIENEVILQGEELLTFKMLPDDPKLEWVSVDQSIEYKGEVWRITKRQEERTSQGILVVFESKPTWYDLVDDVIFGDIIITTKTIAEGLAQILADTEWTVGGVPDNPSLYSYEEKNLSVLQLIRNWAALTGSEVQFLTGTKEVLFKEQVGVERGIGFRYGRNLDEVTRTYLPPQVTRMYPLGANDLDITTVNAGIPYIENFNWYLGQGLTLEEARAKYMKEYIWKNTDYILALNLMDAAVEKLANLAYPTISYECKVMDLSTLTGLEEDRFNIGDTVRVQDDTFNLDIRTRIVRMIKRPYEPWNNEVELAYLKPGITNELISTLTSGSDSASQWKLLVDESSAMNITTSLSNICNISVTTTNNANGIVGGHVVATGVGSGTAKFSVFIDDVRVGDTEEYPFTTGQKINVGIPTWFAQLEEGVHTITLRGQVTGGSLTILENAGRLYSMMTGALGGGVGGSSTVFFINDVMANLTMAPTGIMNVSQQAPMAVTPTDTMSDNTFTGTDTLTVEIV